MLLQGAPVEYPPIVRVCEDLKRIELSLAPAGEAREICVSPGHMTTIVFDVRTDVELQDEARFLEVTRGRGIISLLPPQDMVPGERLRLTAHIGDGPSQQRVTFTLLAHSGLATHQVEVYRDRRSRESFLHEVALEQAKNRELRAELRLMRARLEQSGGIGGLVARKKIDTYGIQVRPLSGKDTVVQLKSDGLTCVKAVSYRADKGIAVQVSLLNLSSEPWMTVDASLVDAGGREMEGLKIRQDVPIPPKGDGPVFVEVDALLSEAQGELSLTLWDDSARSITLHGLKFP
ncbi:DUF2381 family protein [Archangium violaceum]|uniref:DUF2381 family protein n=1 Tax=Archangium violaceum TaxID=83451 RepID=UPI00193C2639|nr:DUF2381 family protein [Archangium violaceum]QRK07382.1 DUF2381 family protein [Archangium violaceum]